METVRFYRFEDDGVIPNNPSLEVIVYPAAFKENTQEIEEVFNRHEWTKLDRRCI